MKSHVLVLPALLVAPALFFAPTVVGAQETPNLHRPALFDDLINCKAIENPEKRLACYDAKVESLDQAQKMRTS
ncbi:MAG: hypothetical protein HC843_09865 [Sphingomonadales bacterium]|nr:hypothetical protein [Sphingomonadales bacterium]